MTPPLPRRRTTALAVALLSIVLSGGCGLPPDRVCAAGEHPVYAVDNPTGRTCIADGSPAPDGFATYPEKRVPQRVGDQYDRWPRADDYPWASEVTGR